MAAYGNPSEELIASHPAGTAEACYAAHIGVTVLLPVLLGIIAGISKAPFFKTSLGFPGHSVIWWFAPILAAKVIAGRGYSATLAGIAAGCALAPFSHGAGRLMGPAAFALAGVVTDSLALVLRLRARTGFALILSAVALGVAANLSRFVLKTFERGPRWNFTLLGVSGHLASYIFFGALTGAMVACALLAASKRRRSSE